MDRLHPPSFALTRYRLRDLWNSSDDHDEFVFLASEVDALLQEKDQEWKQAINKQQQPTLCNGSDQIDGLSPAETITVLHAHVVEVLDAIAGIVRQRAEAAERARAHEKRENQIKTETLATWNKQIRRLQAELAERDAALAALEAKWRAKAQDEALHLYSEKTPDWNRIRTSAGRQLEYCAADLAAVRRQHMPNDQ